MELGVYSSTWGVTKHRDQCLSLTGINWVSNGVSFNFVEIHAYQKCLLLMQCRVVDDNDLLRKKQSNLVGTGLLQLSNRLQALLVEQ